MHCLQKLLVSKLRTYFKRVVLNSQVRKNCTNSSSSSRAVDLHSSIIQPSKEKRGDILFLHGLFGQGHNFRTSAKKVSENTGFSCHLIDLRNHGNSPHTPEMSNQLMAIDVLEYIKKHKLSKPTVLGHSMGGRVAMRLALDYPSYLHSLIVEDVSPVIYQFTKFQKYIEYMKSIPLSKIKARNDADVLLKDLIPEHSVRSFLLTNLTVDPHTNEWKWKVNLDAIRDALPTLQHTTVTDGATYQGKTLFIAGAQSNYILPEHTPIIKKLFPHSRIEIVEGSGHWIHADKPDAFVALVSNFLTSDN